MQNLLEAGVGCGNAQLSPIPFDRGQFGFIVRRPIWRRRVGGTSLYDRSGAFWNALPDQRYYAAELPERQARHFARLPAVCLQPVKPSARRVRIVAERILISIYPFLTARPPQPNCMTLAQGRDAHIPHCTRLARVGKRSHLHGAPEPYGSCCPQ